MAHATEAPAGDTSSTPPAEPSRRVGSRLYVLVAAGVLVVAQLALRAWLLAGRDLYADDLLYGSQAVATPLLSAEYLLDDRDGHLMPAALLLHGVLYRAFPLQWEPLAVALLVLQLAASLAVLRLLRVLLGDRPALLLPLAVYLFCPLGLGSFGWWSAAMNSVPLQIGLAWVVADAVLLARTRRRRYAVTGTVALVLTLLFFERAVFVPFLAFAVVALLLHARGIQAPVRTAWARGRELWLGSAATLTAWAVVFLTAVPDPSTGAATPDQVAELTRISAASLAPALLGGPWRWADVSGPPLEAAPSWAAPAAVAGLALLVTWTAVRRRAGGPLWLLAAGHVLAGAVVVGIGRGSMEFADVLPLTYRYFAAEAVLAAVVVAFLVLLPARRPAAGALSGPVLSAAAVLAAAAFVASSVWSTVTYREAWASEPTGAYLATARASLADAADAPLLDFDVPESVLWSHWAPWNRGSSIFGPLDDRPEFAAATPDLRTMDESGRLRPAAVVPLALVADGPVPGCGWSTEGATSIGLTADVPAGAWTAELRYVAERDGTLAVALGSGEPVLAPVRAGSGAVFVRLSGEGRTLEVTGQGPGPSACLAGGAVGDAALR